MTITDEGVKKLGFGLMRLPQKDGAIDIEQTKTMVDMFLNAGFNYFDTAWAYQGSEDAIRQALVERYPRDRYFLATKNAAWINCKTREEAIDQFETSLRRTGAGYFDFYLLHNLGESRTHFFEDFDLWNWAFEKKREGLIKHVGFSFHSTPEELEAILTAHPEAEFVQLQINYADWDNPAIRSRECYEVARRHGKPVIIMEPVRGGSLAIMPAQVQEVFKKAEPEMSVASWAIRYAASLSECITVLSGMSNLAQMEDNLSYMEEFQPLSAQERTVLEQATEIIHRSIAVPCTACRYCMPCPMGVDIPDNFSIWNKLGMFGQKDAIRQQWTALFPDAEKASHCVRCGKCEAVCPQHLPIRDSLAKLQTELDSL